CTTESTSAEAYREETASGMLSCAPPFLQDPVRSLGRVRPAAAASFCLAAAARRVSPPGPPSGLLIPASPPWPLTRFPAQPGFESSRSRPQSLSVGAHLQPPSRVAPIGAGSPPLLR